ncbi:cysteine peptidase family C39 domain-containing protein [Mycoplasmoides alvi]|uniref:cysteine peptidase family C39 domain-containing protein n=1 Tax=Mycoplasmoides alvi TaxID=78580 RepID=UPI00051AAD7C|nr:cysteine peptidase family C39 domain-containing protein [Mycoplasmoides alvi]
MEVIYQEKENECGACVIAMLANEINDLSLDRSDIINNAIISNFGMNLYDLEELGLKYGLQIESYECEFKELEDISSKWHIGLVKRLNGFHYIIFRKKKKNLFLIVDSSKGKYELNEAEFKKEFANLICTVESIKFDLNKITKNKKINLFNFISWKILIVCLFFELFVVILSLIGAQFSKLIIDATIGYGTLSNLIAIISPFLMIKLAELFTDFGINLIQGHNSKIIYKNIWLQLFKLLNKHTFNFYEKKPYGTLFELDSHITNLINFCLIKITNFITSLILSIVTLGILISTHVFFLIISIIQIIAIFIFVIIQFYLNKSYLFKSINNLQKHNDYLSKFSNLLLYENFFNEYEEIVKSIKKNLNENSKLNYNISIETSIIDKIFEFVKFIFSILIISLGISLIISEKNFDLSKLIYISTIQALLISNVDTLIKFGFSYNSFISSYKKINGYFNITEHEKAINKIDKITKVSFKNINLTDGIKEIFQNWSCNLDNLTVLTGKNGSGKSSLLKSLTCRFKMKSGEIKINDYSIDEINNEWFAKNVIYINGNNISNSLLISEKIFQFVQNHSFDEKIYSILNKINFFETSPTNYSSGQIQIARLIMLQKEKNKLILLDETLSAINYSLKESVFNCLIKPLVEDNFVIFAEHDPNLIKLANKIVEVR